MNLPAPNFIKVDVEKAEVRFLRGAMKTISQYRPLMVIEFHTLDLLREGYSLLTDLGYRCVGQSNQVVDETVLSHLEHFHESVLFVP